MGKKKKKRKSEEQENAVKEAPTPAPASATILESTSSPIDVAVIEKNKGDTAFQKGQYNQAIQFYSQAIAHSASKPGNVAFLVSIFSNRAFTSLMMKVCYWKRRYTQYIHFLVGLPKSYRGCHISINIRIEILASTYLFRFWKLSSSKLCKSIRRFGDSV
jgi:hypothetical protein